MKPSLAPALVFALVPLACARSDRAPGAPPATVAVDLTPPPAVSAAPQPPPPRPEASREVADAGWLGLIADGWSGDAGVFDPPPRGNKWGTKEGDAPLTAADLGLSGIGEGSSNRSKPPARKP